MSIWESLQQVIAGGPDKIPSDYKTTQEWSKFFKKSMTQTQRMIKMLREKGLANTKEFRVPISNSVIKPIPYHRIDPKILKQ